MAAVWTLAFLLLVHSATCATRGTFHHHTRRHHQALVSGKTRPSRTLQQVPTYRGDPPQAATAALDALVVFPAINAAKLKDIKPNKDGKFNAAYSYGLSNAGRRLLQKLPTTLDAIATAIFKAVSAALDDSDGMTIRFNGDTGDSTSLVAKMMVNFKVDSQPGLTTEDIQNLALQAANSSASDLIAALPSYATVVDIQTVLAPQNRSTASQLVWNKICSASNMPSKWPRINGKSCKCTLCTTTKIEGTTVKACKCYPPASPDTSGLVAPEPITECVATGKPLWSVGGRQCKCRMCSFEVVAGKIVKSCACK